MRMCPAVPEVQRSVAPHATACARQPMRWRGFCGGAGRQAAGPLSKNRHQKGLTGRRGGRIYRFPAARWLATPLKDAL